MGDEAGARAQGVAPFGQDMAVLAQVRRPAGGRHPPAEEAAAMPPGHESFPEVLWPAPPLLPSPPPFEERVRLECRV